MRKEKAKLIPFEKSERVIYLADRGERKPISMGAVVFGCLGVLCILYCIAIGINGFGTRFFLIWGVIGGCGILLSILLASKRVMDALPGWLKGTAVCLFCLGLVLLFAVEGMVLTGFRAEAQPGADYCLILGAQWKKSGPSEVLRRRLDRALTYLDENPDTIAVVTGGQGRNEPMAEADGMKQYLMSAGIAEERILTEDKSVNTVENLAFSARMLDKENCRVVIVTNNFHITRALKLAKKQGYHAEGLAADSVVWMLPNNMLREFFGMGKDFLVGNL